MKAKPISRVDSVLRLQEIARLVANPPEFKVGDLVVDSPVSVGGDFTENAYKNGVCPVGVVVEVAASFRDLELGFPKESQPPGPAVNIYVVESDGTAQSYWRSAWTLTPAPASTLSDGTPLNS